jgi:C4-dicarboxylate-specific signal transduction histidine kinase
MFSNFWSLFSSAEYAPHGICLLWQPQLMALHASSDAAVAIAYYSIPFALMYFVWKRTDLAFPGLFMLFSAFILACGTTHLMSIVTLWRPDYWLEGIVKAVTAIVSVISAFVMWRAMPQALGLPSTSQLEEANESLGHEIAERKRAQAALDEMNSELEGRVASRTFELHEEIRERKRSEYALRQSEMYLAEAQRLSHTGSFGWRVEDDEIIWSEETFRIFDHDSSTSPTLDFVLQRIHPDDRSSVEQFLERARIEAKDWRYEHRLLMKDNSVKHVHVVAHAVKDASGRLEFIGAVMDVTAAKRASDALSEMQIQLTHANRIATMGQITASIAHELSQPIVAAGLNASGARRNLKKSPPELEEVRDALDAVLIDLKRARNIIQRTRDHFKKAPLQRRSLDLKGTILEVIELSQAELRKNRITVETRLAEALPPMNGDRVQVQQVLLNLILNAVEAMKSAVEGPRELLIVTEQGDGIVVTVADTGPGIDPDHVERVFDAFYTTKSTGLGVGLSICRSIIVAHGGRLWAETNKPRGAIFRFSLPMEEHGA